MEKNGIFLRFIKKFYGLTGPLDEYRVKEVNRIGNNAFVLSFIYLFLSSVVVALLTVKFSASALLPIYLLVNIIFISLVNGGYVFFEIHRLGLDKIDVSSENYKGALNRLKKRCAKIGIFVAILLWIFELVLNYVIFDVTIVSTTLSLSGYIRAIVVAALVTLFLYFHWRALMNEQ
ncbi:DUF3278 domain-containing protein [Levilactobacillus brevis]|uniref:DUF3278 domain-containing protein n=1 Tax=Levilactobacillus brevis TaxID=1580 RepID=UPI0025A4DA40|nr:DUF3278 domain-containing protein [Levilactobacillus brevis]MDM5047826.1 DUF3278 domain-containing protein [Levilactobacillus brevis]MDM5047870.1 DUF3278 domain-containing protein [Levilactobacillus brevis]MDM5047882.1 DUF3278 domain-containing protein [Levilactobacillus brevis]